MKKLLVVAVVLVSFLPGCGHGGNVVVGSQVKVVISPPSATIHAGTQLQFTATVTNTSNTAVTWQVNGTAGGNATVGTISTTGLYTAPAAVPASGSVTVAAVSQADSTASSSATITITASSGFSVSPSSITVLAGATQQFSVTAAGGAPAPTVSWQVGGVTGGNATAGTISTSGLYTAPASPPSGQRVTVTAISQANSSQTASAQVTVAPSLATLNGQYAFTFSGRNSQGFLAAAGSFQADGKGNVTNGVEDINSAAGVTNVPFTGTYTVGQDGRGSLVLSGSGLGTQTFQMVVLSGGQARLMRFDTFATSSGNLDLQDSSAFTASALSGNFVLNLDGVDSFSSPLSAIALVALNAAGGISPTISFMDENDNGGVTLNSPVNGTYTVGSNGRGTLTLSGPLGTLNFALYVLSAQKFRLVSTDVTPTWNGSGNLQQGSIFNNASLSGNMVFAVGGNNTAGGVDDAGQFFSTGGGGINSGIGDENSNGTVTAGFAFTGTYNISLNGHGILSLASVILGTMKYSLYLQSASQALLLRTDSGAVSSGSLSAQAQSSFSLADINGPFGFTVGGVSSTGPLDKIGQFTADGLGKASGTEDINDTGTLNGNLALTATYSLASTGRGSLNVTAGGGTRVLNLYLVSPNQMFLIGMDADQVLAGRADQQFP